MEPTSRPSRERYRLQTRAADELLVRVAAGGDPALPDAVPWFDDRAAVLAHLAARWSRDLAGSLDAVLDLPDDERERAAADAAAQVAARRPALHAVLLHHADDPVVRAARSRDRALAGLRDAPVHAGHVDPRVTRRAHGEGTGGPAPRCVVRRVLLRAA